MADAGTVHTSAAASYDAITRQHQKEAPPTQVGGGKGKGTGGADDKPVPYRHFNNYIKKMLVQYAAHLPTTARNTKRGYSVLDLASGRGGDLGKWIFAHVVPPSKTFFGTGKTYPAPASVQQKLQQYLGVDISPECIAEAQRRIGLMTQGVPPEELSAMELDFRVGNCFESSFWEQLESERLTVIDSQEEEGNAKKKEKPQAGAIAVGRPFVLPGEGFDVVSVQFAFHYGCDALTSVERTMESIAQFMSPHGSVFIATIVDADHLTQRFLEGKLKNSLFDIRLKLSDAEKDQLVGQAREKEREEKEGEGSSSSSPSFCLPLGLPYHFYLEGHVDNVEFVIPMDDLVNAAAKVGLRVNTDLTFPFASKVPQYESDPKVKKQLRGAALSVDEKELVGLYRTVCFEKVTVVGSSQ